MKKIVLFAVVCCCAVFFVCSTNSNDSSIQPGNSQSTKALDSLLTPISAIAAAYANRDSNISVIVKGTVTRILSDDTIGDIHQRFIIQLSNGQTVLIVHNIDVSTRINGIVIGSTLYVHGDYLWNSQGGLIHWTHRDPNGKHENGWIVFKNEKYE